MPDSPRWCARCEQYGDHHTDRCPKFAQAALLAEFVSVRQGHEDLGEDDYHEWITLGEKVRADVNGRINRRITYKRWQKWICNNSDCAAWALVSDDGIRHLIEGVEQRG